MQVIPRARELAIEPGDLVDPLGEDSHSPATGIFHRYPDRCLLLALDRCAIYCRHCNRRRLVGQEESPISREDLEQRPRLHPPHARHPRRADLGRRSADAVDARLEEILAALRAIPHVEIIRIGTRVPVVLPMRIDDELCAMLQQYHPLFVNTHFNHPKELTPRARAACEKLADAGIPVGNQTVLLRGVNSSVRVLRKLFTELLRCRVRPYYLFQGDVAAGTSHLRTPVETGIELMQELRGHISGLAIPHLVIDTPGGMGKVSIGPDYVVARGARQVDAAQLRGQAGRLPAARRQGRHLRVRRGVLRRLRTPRHASDRRRRSISALEAGADGQNGASVQPAQFGLAREADATAVPDQLVPEADPPLVRDTFIRSCSMSFGVGRRGSGRAASPAAGRGCRRPRPRRARRRCRARRSRSCAPRRAA